jgi:transcriptional regulator with XRE-family HTH domain
MQTMLKATRPRYSREPFVAALKGLMAERHLSFRQLAYMTQLSAGYLNHLTKGTRPASADPVIGTIAAALRIEADFFREYRLRQVAEALDSDPATRCALWRVVAPCPGLQGRGRDARTVRQRQRRFAVAGSRGLTFLTLLRRLATGAMPRS